jgi:hypothetical protein
LNEDPIQHTLPSGHLLREDLDVFSPWYNISFTMARCPLDDYQVGGALERKNPFLLKITLKGCSVSQAGYIILLSFVRVGEVAYL